ncbi:hypothetical protein L227DRAFT_574373 [Lentinus tigrinus ALCF2SS1-6]|uniref:Uncharacterized protein n=1 Tax=Lentinus tigrinus ALCF2SS1-6 TaxID=1328759 RepID=A0A5C2SDF0_9APHY|nr:hypothetical protein L227DRAFT_574373 [Lentinus tigrinus ALCF2SS1-6]
MSTPPRGRWQRRLLAYGDTPTRISARLGDARAADYSSSVGVPGPCRVCGSSHENMDAIDEGWGGRVWR